MDTEFWVGRAEIWVDPWLDSQGPQEVVGMQQDETHQMAADYSQSE